MSDFFETVNGVLRTAQNNFGGERQPTVPERGGKPNQGACRGRDDTAENSLEPDICANRHRGNAESTEAHKTIQRSLQARSEAVYEAIKLYSTPVNSLGGDVGLTVDELAEKWDTTPNAISGRFSELARDGRIVKCGRRKTRSGCSASVWRGKE